MNNITTIAKERVDLAKALLRAVDKPKAKAKAAASDPNKGNGETEATKGNGEATA